jgi:hypothetical protein
MIEPGVVRNTQWIFTQLREFMIKLESGDLSLDVFGLLKENSRVERLISILECINDSRSRGTYKIQNTIHLRVSECEYYYQVKKELSEFALKFDLSDKKSGKIKELLSQFSLPPNRVLLRSVCRMRSSEEESIVLELRQITPGVNFITVLRAAFAPLDPKSIKRYWQLDWILMLLRATGAKAGRKTMMKLTADQVGIVERHNWRYSQVSISSTLKAQIFLTNVVSAAFF